MNLFERAFHLAHYVFPEGGTCLEFGVFKGTTYCYQAAQIMARYHASSLIGFDSWCGLPEESAGVWIPERHAVGEFCAAKSEVLAKLKQIGAKPNDPRFRFVDGFFSETLKPSLQKEISDLAFINIDVDIHRSTIELLDFVEPLLRPGVVLYWDDWKDPTDDSDRPWGEHLAWDEWYAPRRETLEVETIEVNPLNQRTMVVTRVGDRRLVSPLPLLKDVRIRAYELTAPSADSLQLPPPNASASASSTSVPFKEARRWGLLSIFRPSTSAPRAAAG